MIIKRRKCIIIVYKKRNYFSCSFILYPSLPRIYHINIIYFKFDARKGVNIASFLY